MMRIDYCQVEEELDLVIPTIYRFFVDAVNQRGFDLQIDGICDTTESLLARNWQLRLALRDSDPAWKPHFFHFGVDDGCGNYFFLPASSEDEVSMKLWAHDPPGIEDVGDAAGFFSSLLDEIESRFSGPNKHGFDGSRHLEDD